MGLGFPKDFPWADEQGPGGIFITEKDGAVGVGWGGGGQNSDRLIYIHPCIHIHIWKKGLMQPRLVSNFLSSQG